MMLSLVLLIRLSHHDNTAISLPLAAKLSYFIMNILCVFALMIYTCSNIMNHNQVSLLLRDGNKTPYFHNMRHNTFGILSCPREKIFHLVRLKIFPPVQVMDSQIDGGIIGGKTFSRIILFSQSYKSHFMWDYS